MAFRVWRSHSPAPCCFRATFTLTSERAAGILPVGGSFTVRLNSVDVRHHHLPGHTGRRGHREEEPPRIGGDAIIQQGDVRIVIVEDHPVLRLGMAVLFRTQSDMTVVAEASTREAAVAAADMGVDLVLVPIRLSGSMEGLEVCQALKRLGRPPLVLMYTSFSSPSDSSLAFLAGADSFLSKANSEHDLLEAVRATANGERVWRPDPLMQEQALLMKSTLEHTSFTSREREVLVLLLQRYSNPEISKVLCIEVSTVKTHVTRVLQKLGLASREALFSPSTAALEWPFR